jgi:ribonuclease HI
MKEFQMALEQCELFDMGYRGPKFTWSNCQESQTFIKERLDRGVANHDWYELYPDAEVIVEVSTTSDHAVLLVHLTGVQNGAKKYGFRYEAKWTLEQGYNEVVSRAWENSRSENSQWAHIEQKIAKCKWGILRWQRETSGAFKKSVSQMKKHLEKVQEREDLQAVTEARELKKEINILLDQDDMKWRQRAKADWLKMGDRNTKFFHACANQRRQKNWIKKIKTEAGVVLDSSVDIRTAFVEYFSTLFSAGPGINMEPCLQALDTRVTESMNKDLLKVFTEEEVEIALKQMGAFKAPGPDGLPAGFFQHHWEILGGEVSKNILAILNSGIMPNSLNLTYIALIPKMKNPMSVSDFRPISLCNVLYKLISKVLANRLKKILPLIISPTQSAFIPGRLITDNVLAAYETLHTMNSRMNGKKGFMAVKLDMSKAYDRVEWGFLEETMKRLGFAPQWIRLIMMCVSTVRYSVVVNGEPCGSIAPSRGLRQGDPISPYLFLLCAEVLSSMLTQANREGSLMGVPTSKLGPRVSHLFFADDSLLFCRSNLPQWNSLTTLLRKYEEASGQRLNNNKTAIFFSKNTPMVDREKIVEIAGIPATQRYDSYLGLPALVGRSRVAAFRSIKERIWKKLQDWKVKFLSQAGKEVLLKAVIQAIPTYSMSVFMLPRSLCLEINSLMSKFWWGHQDKTRVHWMSWRRLGESKANGGMGFRDLEIFNQALLAKQAWRLWKSPDSFLSKIMKAKYYRGGSFLEARLGNRPSFAWRSIYGSSALLKEGLIWRIGNGKKVSIWKDRWIPKPSTFMVQSQPILLDPCAKVCDLIDDETRWWKPNLLEQIFSQPDVQAICSIPISGTNQEDRQIWRGTKNGLFSVKSAYYMQVELKEKEMAGCSTRKDGDGVWRIIWGMKIPNVEKNFLWRACKDILPTRANLHRRKIVEDASCPICGREEETTSHILWQCPSAMDVWGQRGVAVQKMPSENMRFTQVVEKVFDRGNMEEFQQFVGLARRIWKRRNDVVHGKAFVHPDILAKGALLAVEEFVAANETGVVASTMAPHSNAWTAPQPGWLKVNWDASFQRTHSWMGFGVVVRDEKGRLVAATSKTVAGSLEPALAEAWGALIAIRLCKTMNFRNVHLEGDAQVVIQAVHSSAEDWSSMGLLVADIKEELTSLQQWRMTFIRRDGNSAAHILSKEASNNFIDKCWLFEPPECIQDVVLRERDALPLLIIQ